MKYLEKILVLVLFTIVTFGCEKFENGGSLAKADKKISETLWKIESATDLEDMSDITQDFTGELWEFAETMEFKINSTLKGVYTFSADMLTLIITKTGGGVDTYMIDRLDNEALWLIELGEEELHFIPN